MVSVPGAIAVARRFHHQKARHRVGIFAHRLLDAVHPVALILIAAGDCITPLPWWLHATRPFVSARIEHIARLPMTGDAPRLPIRPRKWPPSAKVILPNPSGFALFKVALVGPNPVGKTRDRLSFDLSVLDPIAIRYS